MPILGKKLPKFMILKLVILVGAVLTASAVGWASIAPRTPAVSGMAIVPQDNVASLFAANCAKCHGADGRAQTPRGRSLQAQDFTNARWKAKTSVSDAAATIRDGYQEMPSYKKRLTAAQIQSLAEYTKGFPH